MAQAAADSSENMYPLLGPDPMSLLTTLFVLLTVGQILITGLLMTLLLSKQVRKRNATLINLLVVTIVGAIPPALL